MTKFQLVEIDPATGEVDQILSPAPTTWNQAARHLAETVSDAEEDWNDHRGECWPWLMIRPAA